MFRITKSHDTFSSFWNTLQAHGMIEMPNPPPEILIFEPFVETDEILFSSQSTNKNADRLMWKGNSRWVEITVGVIGKRGSMHSLMPSVTVKESGDILSLEEKFQGASSLLPFFDNVPKEFLWFISFEILILKLQGNITS